MRSRQTLRGPSRNQPSRAGSTPRTLAVSLTAPSTISSEFTIQEVLITDLDVGAGTVFPTRTARAASSAYQDGLKWLQTADQLPEGTA